MYYLKKQIIKFGYEILVCNKYHVYLLMNKKIEKKLIHFVMQLRKSRFFGLARGVLLDNGVTSPCPRPHQDLSWTPPLPLHGRYYILLKTKGAHVLRGRKYSYGEAWSNMNTIKRNWLPFTSVYINPNVTFIYYNQESVLWATHNVWYKHHIPNTHPCTSPSQHNEILFSMEKSYPPLVREPTQSGVRRKCSGMLNHTILGQTPKSNLAE